MNCIFHISPLCYIFSQFFVSEILPLKDVTNSWMALALVDISFISSLGFSSLLFMLETCYEHSLKKIFSFIPGVARCTIKGCFFLEEDGEIISHQYKMQIAQRSLVYITIKPLNLSQAEGKFKFSMFKKKNHFMPALKILM